MKLRLKYFGIGMFIAGLLFTLNHQFNLIDSGIATQAVTSNKDLSKKNDEIKKLKNELADLQKENDTLLEQLAATEDAQNTNSAPSTDPTEEVEPSAGITETIYVYEGMTLYEIGQQAEDLGLIENGRTLELFLSKPEFARKIQKGQFELSSTMTIEQMAKLLTGQKSE